LVDLHQILGSLRDTDVAQAATDLTLANTAMQAALAAHGSMNVKSLFDYIG
jgi:flagellin-like hook-associated protein FlgL